MPRLALSFAVASVLAAMLATPGPFVALGFGIAAIGTGWIGYARRAAPGGSRLVAAGAITLGGIGLALGAARVVLVLAAIDHLTGMFGPLTS
jgi:hypothetical protein